LNYIPVIVLFLRPSLSTYEDIIVTELGKRDFDDAEVLWLLISECLHRGGKICGTHVELWILCGLGAIARIVKTLEEYTRTSSGP
jgi:hypothetical protein